MWYEGGWRYEGVGDDVRCETVRYGLCDVM